MKRDCLILTVVVGAVLLLHVGCQELTMPEESENRPPGPNEPVVQKTACEKGLCPIVPKPEPNKPPTKPKPDVKKPAPEIRFEELIHDFGEVGSGSSNVCQFKFTNTGNAVLKIGKIHCPCGCTVAKLPKKEYAPGESGAVKITYSAPRYPGSITKSCSVSSNAKTRPRVTLTVKARVAKKVEYEPKRLILSLKKENAGCPDITLTSVDKQPFSIKQFKSTRNCITVDFDPALKATKFVLKPKVDMAKLRQSKNGSIEIGLTHPGLNKVTIVFSVVAPFKAQPQSLVVLKAVPQEPVVRKVWILSNYNEDFEIESTSSDKGMIKVLTQKKVGNRYEFQVEITPPAIKSKTGFTDFFRVNIKGGEKLAVMCRGFYSRE